MKSHALKNVEKGKKVLSNTNYDNSLQWGLGVRRCVGDVISQLFPRGFLLGAYQARQSVQEAAEVFKQNTGRLVIYKGKIQNEYNRRMEEERKLSEHVMRRVVAIGKREYNLSQDDLDERCFLKGDNCIFFNTEVRRTFQFDSIFSI